MRINHLFSSELAGHQNFGKEMQQLNQEIKILALSPMSLNLRT